MPERMPAFFFGHGNPMNALLQNRYTAAWKSIGEKIPSPKAILAISAHWYVPELAVTAMKKPRTIHDFGGFPDELYEFDYPAPGSPELAERVRKLLIPENTAPDQSWGLDHGTWSVLCHLFPRAAIPVVQLSINESEPASFHYEIGKRLAPLREEGVLIAASGNIVHNLHAYAWGERAAEPYDWAIRFEKKVRELLVARDHKPLIAYEAMGRDAMLSAPTPDHYLPLLYVAALQNAKEKVSFPVEGIDGGSVSMLSIRIG